MSNLSNFGKGFVAPPPAPPPDEGPGITPEEEAQILAATLPVPQPEVSFVARNSVPIMLGSGVLILGALGLFLMTKI